MSNIAIEGVEHVRPYVELTAVAAGAVSGALHAEKYEYDFVGVGVIGIVSGLGGGLIRDVMLGSGPALALRSPVLLVTALIAAMGGALFATLATRLWRSMWVVDTLSLGLFAVAGLQRGEAAGLGVVPCVFLGVVTTVGGGLVRDVLCREIPRILLPGQPYAVISLAAATVYLTAIRALSLAPLAAELLAVAAAVAIRTLAAWRGWMVPRPPDVPRSLRERMRDRSRRSPPP